MTLSRPAAYTGFSLALASVYAASVWVVGQVPRMEDPAVLAVAVTLDLTVLVPVLYYLVFVRGRGWPVATVSAVFLASLGAASLLVPTGHQAALRAIQLLAVPVELSLVGWAVLKLGHAVRRARALGADEDIVTLLRSTFGALGFGRAGEAAAYEVAVLTYALGRWRTPMPDGPEVFSVHRRASYGAVVAALLTVTFVELVGVHVLVARWSEGAAWALTALSLYAALWLLGDFQAIRHRPVRIEPDRLRLRLGLRWDAEVPFAAVESIVPLERAPNKGDAYLDLTAFGTPRYLVRLYGPITARGPYGWQKPVRSLGFAVDDRERFEAALRERFGAWQREHET